VSRNDTIAKKEVKMQEKNLLPSILKALAYFIVLSLFATSFGIQNLEAKILIVSPAGEQYSYIEEAVADASYGDTIAISSGEYSEDFVINKSLTILGENSENVIIRAKRRVDAFKIGPSNISVRIEGLSILAPHYGHSVLVVGEAKVSIINCSFNETSPIRFEGNSSGSI